MPELPEVEAIRSGLDTVLKGQVIKDVDSDSPRHLNYPLQTYRKKIVGLKVIRVSRRAKLLYLELSGNNYIAIHLKMSGQLVFKHGKKVIQGGHPIKDGAVVLPNKFTHAIFYFKSGDVLYFNDIRKFGWTKLLTEEEFQAELLRLGYGPEPLEKAFTLEYLTSIIKKYPRRAVKAILMDQKLIAGLGNIYCDEVLYYAGVRPTRPAGKVTANEIKKIFEGIKKILPKAIKAGGSSIASHLDAFGRTGSYSKYHKVYGLYGEPCSKCGTILERVTVAGRTSTYCPKEQK